MTLGQFLILSAASVIGVALLLRSRPLRRWLTPATALPPFEPDVVVDTFAAAAFADPEARQRALAALPPKVAAHPLVPATLDLIARNADATDIRLQIDLIAHQRREQLQLPSLARALCGMGAVAAPIVSVLVLFGMAAGILAPLAMEAAAGSGLQRFAPLLAGVLALLVFRAHATGVAKRVNRREEMLYGLMLELAYAAGDGLRGRELRARLRLVVYRDRALHLREAA